MKKFKILLLIISIMLINLLGCGPKNSDINESIEIDENSISNTNMDIFVNNEFSEKNVNKNNVDIEIIEKDLIDLNINPDFIPNQMVIDHLNKFNPESLKASAIDLTKGEGEQMEFFFRKITLGQTTLGELCDSFSNYMFEKNLYDVLIPPYHRISVPISADDSYDGKINYNIPDIQIYSINDTCDYKNARDCVVVGYDSLDTVDGWGIFTPNKNSEEYYSMYLYFDYIGRDDYINNVTEHKVFNNNCILKTENVSLDLLNLTNSQLWLARDTNVSYSSDAHILMPIVYLDNILNVYDGDILLNGNISSTESSMNLVLDGETKLEVSFNPSGIHDFYNSKVHILELTKDLVTVDGNVSLNKFNLNGNTKDFFSFYKSMYPSTKTMEGMTDLTFVYDNFNIEIKGLNPNEETFDGRIKFINTNFE